jgi:hypothetical protein
LGAFLLGRKHYWPAALAVGALIAHSATSGSKAGFLLAAVAGGYLYKDLSGFRLHIKKTTVTIAIVMLITTAVLILLNLNVTTRDICARLVGEAEATIMVYIADDPAEAGRDVTLLAAVHRGVARFLGDESARDVNTLFGFKLSAIYYGANTFTGPNSSVPAYFLCNFQGMRVWVGLGVIASYFLLMWLFVRMVITAASDKFIILLPFAISSINTFCQDYYTGMSDLTIVAIVSICYWLHALRFKH